MDKRKLLKISLSLFLFLLAIEAAGHLIAWKASKREDLGPARPEKRLLDSLKFENSQLRKRIETLRPNDYILVDTSRNALSLVKGGRMILMAIVSCGSGAVLVDSEGKREWLFETPRGEFTIQSKYEKPMWIKPDWAFIEEGKPIPQNVMERMETGMLGDYALGFGNGYFIHGTLYTRLLGKNITHGCIRMGDKDLKKLYETVTIGAKILIF